MLFLEEIKKAQLFWGMEDEDIKSLIKCLNAVIKKYKKGSYILSAGEPVDYVGIILEGQAGITKDDADGGRSVIAQLMPSDHFAETLCCAGVKISPVNVIAQTEAVAIQLDFKRILTTCPNTCRFHSQLIENMLMVLASKNLYLQERTEYLSQKSIRGKVMKYLYNAAKGSNRSFSIPYSREQLADYLSIDRSALSRELSKMKDEKIIDYWKSEFKILQ